MSDCPCKTGKKYSECCEPLITGSRPAQTAEELMRSRYTAYATTKVKYIIETSHPDSQENYDENAVREWSEESEWLGLEILDTIKGGPEDDLGQVEFIARYRQGGDRQKHHEVATFSKVDGTWYFVDGKTPEVEQIVRKTPKVGRNDPCPCGSGKKYKKCCRK